MSTNNDFKIIYSINSLMKKVKDELIGIIDVLK